MLQTSVFSRFTSCQFSSFSPSRFIPAPPLVSTTFLALFLLILSCPCTFAAQITLAWDANTAPDLAGYKIYYGTASGTYESPINVGNVTIYTLTGLALGQTYFIAATAYSTSNSETGYSNEVSGVATDRTQITVATNPSGLQIVVDNITYTAPQIFGWVAGSSHNLSVSSPQPGTSGVLYSYSSWSDGGPSNHSVTAPSSPTTYTANFTSQYSLTTSASPPGGGTVTPSGTNWYNSGQIVSLLAAQSAGYSFSKWTGDLTLSTNPTSLTMSGPKNVTANFTCLYSITPTTNSFGSSGGTGSVRVTGGSACSWTATSNVSWIAISLPSSGIGNGGVTYSVSTNNTAKSRTGTITIAGQAFTVNQSSKKN